MTDLIFNSPLILFLNETLSFFGGIGILSYQITRDIFKGPIYWRLLIDQVFHVGNRSLPLIVITALSTGMVMSLQFGLGLEKFGGKLYVPKLVSATVLREMGPVFTSLMVAARVGAGFASEIGSMVVTQQIDAIRALGTSPIKKIVIPRVLATLLSLPILVGISNIVSNFGALIVGYSELKLDPNFYLLKILTTVTLKDYFAGFGKSFFFALFISIPSCYFGLTVKNGTKEVGIATTKAVVVSSILVLVGDFFLSKLFWILERMS
ncbi:MAG: ABC transporter permease [Deltaproteobacteria bacterium]|jgi:phospholipid/cholesterol/gamma-HCH transport system permease protein|nr:ABC transporter permease [Deltaproteobacteria bacterium]